MEKGGHKFTVSRHFIVKGEPFALESDLGSLFIETYKIFSPACR